MPRASRRGKLHRDIFEANTSVGWAFDVALFVVMLLSVAVVLSESVAIDMVALYGCCPVLRC